MLTEIALLRNTFQLPWIKHRCDHYYLKKNRIYTEIATMLFISTHFGLPIDYSYMQKGTFKFTERFRSEQVFDCMI